jgi:hypothetical protein
VPRSSPRSRRLAIQRAPHERHQHAREALLRHAADSPHAATGQIDDCRDILRVIMAGDVRAWLA